MSTTRWFYVHNDKRVGPLALDQLVQLVVSAAIPSDTLVWHQGLAEWTKADRVPELADLLPPPLPPGAPRHGGAEPPSVPGRGPSPGAPPPGQVPPISPRVEELWRRLEKDPSPRAFAQAAEELRKDGEYEEAVRVCREGVRRYSNYPALRLALARALMESGDLQTARVELESVLQSAPGNILAERLLADCRRGLGLPPRGPAGEPPAAEPPAPAPPEPEAVAAASEPPEEPPATELSDAGDASELLLVPDEPAASEELQELAVEPEEDPAPIPLVPVEDESFELERAGDEGRGWAGPVGGPPPAPKREPTVKAAAPPPAIPASPPPSPPGPPVAAAAPPVPAPAAAVPPASAPPPSVAAKPPAASAPGASSAPPPPRSAPVPLPPVAFASASDDVAEMWPGGRLADYEFAELVREAFARHWTGLLTLNHMGVEKTVRMQEGRLVFASSSSPDDRLGELLLVKGRITLEQYVQAGRAIRKGKRLGTILVEQGALDAKELVKAVVEHTQEIIYSAFQWTEGVYHFTEGASSAIEPITLKLSTPDIILEGIRRIDSWSRIERAAGTLETRYERTPEYLRILGHMNLSPERLALVTELDGEQELGELCRSSTLPAVDVCRTLWAFGVIGLVRRLR